MSKWDEFLKAISPEIKEGCRRLEEHYQYQTAKSKGAAGPDATSVQDNIAYRSQCHTRWKAARISGAIDDRIKLTKEYIEDWGGIRGNGKEKLALYATSSAPKLIAHGLSGISSWSKLLSIHNPRRYAIYDARVAFSLNAFQAARFGRIDFAFFIPQTQNTRITETRDVLERFYYAGTEHIASDALYATYLNLLRSAKGGYALERAEMFLYAIMPAWRERLIEAKVGGAAN